MSQCVITAVVKGVPHPLIGRLITLSHCLRHGGRFHLARFIRHNPAHIRNESSARCLCSARVDLSCWQAELIMSELSGSRSRLICSEMFVFYSGLLVSLGVSCQRSRLPTIRWLNVKQPTLTRLRLGLAHTRRLILSELCAFYSSLSVSLQRDQRINPALESW